MNGVINSQFVQVDTLHLSYSIAKVKFTLLHLYTDVKLLVFN